MPLTMTAILTSLSLVVLEVTGYIADIVTAVVAQPILLIGVAVGLLGTGVSLVKRFM